MPSDAEQRRFLRVYHPDPARGGGWRDRMIRILLITALAAVSLTACSTAPENSGRSGRRTDPSSDSGAELGSQTLRSKDLIAATDEMAMDIASRLDVTNASSPPKIFVGLIENKTQSPAMNWQVFLTRLRAQLNSSGARHGLEFIRERAFVESQRDREYGGKDPDSTATAYESRADYVLTCEVLDLPSGDTNYYLLDYQLVQLRNSTSGPNVGAGAIVWEKAYEVKYQ